MKKLVCIVISLVIIKSAAAQKEKNAPSSRLIVTEQRKALKEKSLVNGIEFRSAGPTVMSGRVVDVDVDPSDPFHFYVAYASGGIWETKNNGTTFSPVFDSAPTINVGDIAVDWKNKIIYAGTGENNSSRSSYAGLGLFKSSDNGKTWEHLGLESTHHTSRIIIHPDDPAIIWVATIGHLFTPNPERGIYKTTDGGKTWKHTLFINENTGVIDLVVNEKNPDVLYAAAWHRERRAWNFVESGSGSGIYKSTNGGETWTLLTNGKNGFPSGDHVGRIGISISKSNPELIYALLDNQKRRPEEKKEEDPGTLSKEELRKISSEKFMQLENQLIEKFLRDNDFPSHITASLVKEKISSKQITPLALVEYLEDANSLLFDTPVTGAEVYRSEDGGRSWKKTHEGYIEDLVFSYGYYFGQIRVHEKNPDKIYIGAFVVLRSDDGGKTFTNINRDNVHVDHHALWINPDKEGHIINGNDGGLNISYDDGENWIRCNNPAVGQFYTVNIDYEKPYNIYGGLQDNGVWVGSSKYKPGVSWQMEGQYPYRTILGGDGMQVAIDPRDNETVYTGYQFGNYFRISKSSGEMKYITPKHELGERPLRWNWQAPVHLSVHNPDIIYMGANKIFRSFNKGDKFEAISADLTAGGKQGDVAYGTITALHESPIRFGLIYAGTDDGLIWVSRDAGLNWTKITTGIPAGYWVRRIQASAHMEGRVYACLNGHTNDDFTSLLFVSEDYGKTWKRTGTDLPSEPVNVVKEDPENPQVIYVGTDHGIYVSLSRGNSFMCFNSGIPPVAIHDLVIHPRDKELVAGTHGRSVYIARVEHLQQLHDSVMNKPIHLFTVDTKKFSRSFGNSWSAWEEPFEPVSAIAYWWDGKNNSGLTLKVKNESGEILYQETLNPVKGINYYDYHLQSSAERKELHKGKNNKYYLSPGKYILQIENGAAHAQTELTVTDEK